PRGARLPRRLRRHLAGAQPPRRARGRRRGASSAAAAIPARRCPALGGRAGPPPRRAGAGRARSLLLRLERIGGSGRGNEARAARLCRRYGALLVLDEVQTGLGRCGRMFACEEEAVEPDVLLLAKGLSGGIAPISALITRRGLWERAYGTLDRYDLHCSTFGGGAVACAAAIATLEVIRRDGLVEAAARSGGYLREKIAAATAGHPLVREVRGRGLLWGIELDAPAGGMGQDLAGQWLVVGMLE